MDKHFLGSIPFIPGHPVRKAEPLSRYLPPIPDGVISTWLKKNVEPGSWILDPFAASPRLSVEAARAGYRVLITANNPIARFLLEMAANPPEIEDMKAALAELAASFIGEERIEPHIRALYDTYCARCGQLISANAFLWEQGNPAPYSRIYTCPSCGDSGEHPCTSYDAAKVSQISNSRLHKARALERVVAANDQDRIHVEQALSVYIPRAMYALITIINKIQGLNISPTDQKYLSALLLYAFDQSNAIWRVESPNDRRRLLTIPRHFRENNIWDALEEGIDLWSVSENRSDDEAVSLTTWPDLPPPAGGICIYEGRLINIIDSLKDIQVRSVSAAIPRPNQAFWTLSALWAGWLWGREAVGTFKSVLHRQRYDWSWHTTALSTVFRQLANYLDPSTPIFGLIGEAEPGFIGSALIAASIAGCTLENIAIRPEQNQAQITWKSEKGGERTQFGTLITKNAIQYATSYLNYIAEPTSYLNTMAAAFSGVITQDKVKKPAMEGDHKAESTGDATQTVDHSEVTPSVIYSTIYNSVREALTYRSGFHQFNILDATSIVTTIKTTGAQTSLFSSTLEKTSSEEEDTIASEDAYAESESTTEKERPTRSSDISESTLLWLRETKEVNPRSATDNYEVFIHDLLVNHTSSTLREIESAACEAFPGLLTPDSDFIRSCLESYSQSDPDNPQHLFLRPEDNPEERQKDLSSAVTYLHQIGQKLGLESEELRNSQSKPYIRWSDNDNEIDYWFFPVVSAAIGEIVMCEEQPPMRGYLVFPGSRANLLIYKLRRDPRLNRAFNPAHGIWRFLKFRHLKSLTETPLLNRENLDQFLSLDPLTFSTPQLWLI